MFVPSSKVKSMNGMGESKYERKKREELQSSLLLGSQELDRDRAGGEKAGEKAVSWFQTSTDRG